MHSLIGVFLSILCLRTRLRVELSVKPHACMLACKKAVFLRISDVRMRLTFIHVFYMRTMASYVWRVLCSRMRGNDKLILKYAKLSEKAFAPTRGSEYAAGYDLRSAYKYIISAHGKELVKTDLQIEVPFGTYGRVAPRSGLAWKNHIDVGAGVIDADYRGNLGVVLFNHSNDDFEIAPGDRIAQLICEKITYPDIEEVKSLDDTNRGAGGFGSTGMK